MNILNRLMEIYVEKNVSGKEDEEIVGFIRSEQAEGCDIAVKLATKHIKHDDLRQALEQSTSSHKNQKNPK